MTKTTSNYDENNIDAVGKLTFRNRIQEKGAKTDYGNRHIAIWRGVTLIEESLDDNSDNGDNLENEGVNSGNLGNDFPINSIREDLYRETLQKTATNINTITTDKDTYTPKAEEFNQSELQIMLEYLGMPYISP